MTRFIHDQFSKDYFDELMTFYGQVKTDVKISGEKREMDILFIPNTPPEIISQNLGLLGRLAATDAIFEPFRNPVTTEEICSCLLKALEVRESIQRQAKRKNAPSESVKLPNLWILTPTASASILNSFRAILDDNWLPGIYFLPPALKTAIVVIHQLPKTSETLWLRVLGRGNVQKQAIDEIEALPSDNLLRTKTLELLYQLEDTGWRQVANLKMSVKKT